MAEKTLQSIDDLKLLSNSKLMRYFVKDPQVRKACVTYLRDMGCTQKEIANALKISTTTVSKDEKDAVDLSQALAQILEDQEINKLQVVKSKLLMEMGDEDRIKKLSVPQMVYSYGVLTDKHRLLQNKSTSNISVAVQTLMKQFDSAADDIKKELEDGV